MSTRGRQGSKRAKGVDGPWRSVSRLYRCVVEREERAIDARRVETSEVEVER